MPAIKKFKVDIKGLSKKERILFDKLIAAAKLIAPLYKKQKSEKYPGANFYPHDATKEEIETAAKINPDILDPYTFVERNKSGSLKAVPFHVKFKKELMPVAKLLREAAQLSEDKSFAQYLENRAQSLLDGDYEKSEIVWLTSGAFDSKFGFGIGPIERYLDKLFFTKCGYQGWAGIIDEKRTEEAERIKNVLLTSQRKILPSSQKVDVSKLRVRIDKTALFSGMIADRMPTGNDLPNDPNLAQKYGSNVTIFATSLDFKFDKDQFPVLKAIFDPRLQKSYSREELYEGSLRCILSHEIAHALICYQDAEKRLGNLFPVIGEILAYVLGVKGFGLPVLKGVLTQKELEAILIMHICRNFVWWLDYRKNLGVYSHAAGAAIATHFYLKQGALKSRGGICSLDFSKLFLCIDELSRVLEHYLALGTYEEAKDFVDKYGSFAVFEEFAPRLKKIKEA